MKKKRPSNDKSAIIKMFYGERGHYELINCHTPEYDRLLDELVENDDELIKRLKDNPELAKMYEKTKDLIEMKCCDTLAVHYAEGFKFGLLIGMEVAESEGSEK